MPSAFDSKKLSLFSKILYNKPKHTNTLKSLCRTYQRKIVEHKRPKIRESAAGFSFGSWFKKYLGILFVCYFWSMTEEKGLA